MQWASHTLDKTIPPLNNLSFTCFNSATQQDVKLQEKIGEKKEVYDVVYSNQLYSRWDIESVQNFFFFFLLKIKNFSDKEEITSTTAVQSTTLGRVTGIQNSTASVQTDL